MIYHPSNRETFNRLVHRFLIHSFIYYKLDDSIIEDHQYDEICIMLAGFKGSDMFREHKYYHYIKNIDSSASGFYIDVFPKPIITTAFRLLYNRTNRYNDFEQLVTDYGYQLEPWRE